MLYTFIYPLNTDIILHWMINTLAAILQWNTSQVLPNIKQYCPWCYSG